MLNGSDLHALSRKRISRRRTLAGLATGSAAVAASVACGNKGQGSPGRSSASQTAKPVSGGQLSIATGVDPTDFDPTGQAANREYYHLPYDSLVTFKSGTGVKPTDLVLQPRLADKWESPDAQTFTFHLHPDAKFANLPPVNGRPLTSADVKWSIEYLARPKAWNSSAFQGLASVDTPDASTAVVHFNSPYAPFLTYIAEYWATMLAHEIFDQDGNFSKTIVGTGAWQLDQQSSQRGQRWVYKKNPAYFRQDRPYLDQVNWLVIADDATEKAAYQTGQLDILGADTQVITAQNLTQLTKDNPGSNRLALPQQGGTLYLNPNKPPLDDLRVRQAILLCIDRSEWVKAFGIGNEDWALAGALPGLFSQSEMKSMLHYDPEQAKQLLSAAGHPNGIDLDYISPGSEKGAEMVQKTELVQAQLKRGNINVVYHPLDLTTVVQRRRTSNFQLAFGGGADYEIDQALYGNFYSKSQLNYGAINDPELDRLAVAQRQEVDPAKRRDVARQAVQRILDQGWRACFFFENKFQLAKPSVQNYGLTFYNNIASIADTWVQK